MKRLRSKLKNKLLIFGLVGILVLSFISAIYMSKQVYFMSKLRLITSATLHTNMGDIKIKFRDDTPKTVENFIKLTNQEFYERTRIHRVVSNFLIEGGDPLSKFDSTRTQWGKGGPGYSFPDEIDDDDKMVRGVVAMVNNGPDTNGSQFFILTQDADWLDKQHTIFADVVAGMDVVDNIAALPTGPTGVPFENITIASIELN
jgi:cyclophilin family peptidyl-prolyl cis-trans isomerase